MHYPLAALTVIFSLGIFTASKIKISFSLIYYPLIISLVLSFLTFKKRILFALLLSCLIFILGVAVLKNSQILSNCHIAKLIPYKSDSISLIGVINNDPTYQNRRVSFILKVEGLRIRQTWQQAQGKVLVKIFGRDRFSYGERLFLKGSLYRPFSFTKGFNYRDYLRRQGIYFILGVKRDDIVKRLDKNAGNPLKSFALRVRNEMKEALVKNLSPFSAGILNAVILGERQNLSKHTRDILVYSGTVHIIAISGLHLGIMAFIILLSLKLMKFSRKPRYILTILLLFFYCILTGANTPVVRATIMATVLLLGYFLERESDIYNSLSLSALIILTVNPWQLFEVSFQLSFLSVLSIVWLSPKIKSIFHEDLNKTPWTRFLISIFSVSLAAWLGLLGLIAYYFKIFSPVTILANMLIVPYMTIIVASGFSLALIGILIPCLTPIFAASNELFIEVLFKVNSFLIAIPCAYFRLPAIPLIYVFLYYALLIMIFNFRKWSN